MPTALPEGACLPSSLTTLDIRCLQTWLGTELVSGGGLSRCFEFSRVPANAAGLNAVGLGPGSKLAPAAAQQLIDLRLK